MNDHDTGWKKPHRAALKARDARVRNLAALRVEEDRAGRAEERPFQGGRSPACPLMFIAGVPARLLKEKAKWRCVPTTAVW